MKELEKRILTDIIKYKNCILNWNCTYMLLTPDAKRFVRVLCPLHDKYCGNPLQSPEPSAKSVKGPGVGSRINVWDVVIENTLETKRVSNFVEIAIEMYVREYGEADLFGEVL